MSVFPPVVLMPVPGTTIEIVFAAKDKSTGSHCALNGPGGWHTRPVCKYRVFSRVHQLQHSLAQ